MYEQITKTNKKCLFQDDLLLSIDVLHNLGCSYRWNNARLYFDLFKQTSTLRKSH